jgi:integrase
VSTSETRRFRKVTGRTKSEVTRKLAELKKARDAGQDITAGPLTVAQLAREWLAKEAATKQDVSTFSVTERFVETKLVPGLGGLTVAKLTPADVESWLGAEAATSNGKAKATLAKYKNTLSRMLSWAQRRQLVTWNVASVAELPAATATSKTRRSLTVVEAQAVLAALDGNRLAPYFTVMLLLGLRPGEVDGLSWDDVDFEKGTLAIGRAMKRASGGEAIEVGLPKTRTPVRVLAMPAPIAAALKVQKAAQAEERLAAGPGYGLEDDRWARLVFLSEIGTPMWPSNVRRAFAAVCTAAGVEPVVPYELRHFCSSLLVAAGVPAHEVQDLLGHTDGRMLDRVYRHRLTPVVDVAATMNGLFG